MLKCFTKMHGAGNDFIIVEPQFFGLSNYRSKENTFSAEENQIMAPIIKETCRQKFGIGADGVLILSSLGAGQFKMTVFNSDSSFGLMCGNGLRCVAAYLFDKKGTGNNFVVSTDSGDKAVSVEQRNPKLFWVSTFLGYPNNFKEHQCSQASKSPYFQNYLSKSQIYSVNLGNDHLFVLISLDNFDKIEKDDVFVNLATIMRGQKPINVNYCTVKNQTTLKIVTCEHGNGVTFACGTGSASSAYAAFKLGLLPDAIDIETRGGLLHSRILKNAEGREEVELDGPAQQVFTGLL